MSVRSDPLISIGMPVRNSQKTLTLAIRSILCQTYQNWELILIDDGSDDDTLGIAQGFSDSRIRLFHHPETLGLPAQLNTALKLGRGSYFARMDGDDVSYPMRLQRQIEFLERYPEIDLLGTGIVVFDGTIRVIGKRLGPEEHAEICARPWSGFQISHPTFMGRMAWFRRYGYRPYVLKAQDQDLLLRSYQDSRFAILPEILLGYREENLDLKKILNSRKYFGRMAFEYFRNGGNYPSAIRAVSEQMLKGLVDILAFASGIKHKILAHRAIPLNSEELREWERIWNILQRNCKQYEGA